MNSEKERERATVMAFTMQIVFEMEKEVKRQDFGRPRVKAKCSLSEGMEVKGGKIGKINGHQLK